MFDYNNIGDPKKVIAYLVSLNPQGAMKATAEHYGVSIGMFSNESDVVKFLYEKYISGTFVKSMFDNVKIDRATTNGAAYLEKQQGQDGLKTFDETFVGSLLSFLFPNESQTNYPGMPPGWVPGMPNPYGSGPGIVMGGVPWWGWLLIGIGGIGLIFGLVFAFRK